MFTDMINGIIDIFINSPIIAMLTIVFAITSSITTFDKRMIQAKKNGVLPANEPMLPAWVGVISWLHWIVMLTMLILNWKYAVSVFIIGFILAVLPVWETLGNILMRPFRPKQ